MKNSPICEVPQTGLFCLVKSVEIRVFRWYL